MSTAATHRVQNSLGGSFDVVLTGNERDGMKEVRVTMRNDFNGNTFFAKPEELIPVRHSVRVTYSDGSTISTEINGTVQEIRDYYRIGKAFNLGGSPPDVNEDNMQRVTNLEFIDEETGS